jgi:hypothetical protein
MYLSSRWLRSKHVPRGMEQAAVYGAKEEALAEEEEASTLFREEG